MELRFMCPTHRKQVTADSSRAGLHWEDWMDKGCALYEQMRYAEAIPFLGCAFELADFLMQRQLPDEKVALSRFTYSGICLARVYEQIGDSETQQWVLDYANARLPLDIFLAGEDHSGEQQQGICPRSSREYWGNNQLLARVFGPTMLKVH